MRKHVACQALDRTYQTPAGSCLPTHTATQAAHQCTRDRRPPKSAAAGPNAVACIGVASSHTARPLGDQPVRPDLQDVGARAASTSASCARPSARSLHPLRLRDMAHSGCAFPRSRHHRAAAGHVMARCPAAQALRPLSHRACRGLGGRRCRHGRRAPGAFPLNIGLDIRTGSISIHVEGNVAAGGESSSGAPCDSRYMHRS